MTPDVIARRNRANAARSTGPRTEAGKTIVAQNARRHGVTARPDPDRTLTWLRLILAKPGFEPADMLARDERTYIALALAEAEVRYAAAVQALRDFEAGEAQSSEDDCDLLNDAGLIEEYLDLSDVGLYELNARERRQAHSLLGRIDRSLACRNAKRQRLLRRYFGEARAQRNKAFAAWIAYLDAEH